MKGPQLSAEDRAFVDQLKTAKALRPAGGTLDGVVGGTIVCCSEHLMHDLAVFVGTTPVANLGGALLLSGKSDIVYESVADAVSEHMCQQVREIVSGKQHKTTTFCVHAPCTAAAVSQMTIVEQIDHMVRGAAKFPAEHTNCLVRVVEGSDVVFYRLDRNAWHRWYREYEIEALGRNDDPDDLDSEMVAKALGVRRFSEINV
ncbi:MAG: hypothetical protein AAB403_20405 [Planctomycetota bacterium]